MTFKTLKHLIHPCLLAVFLTLNSAAFATPPRYLSFTDTPIAANETHVFMIRNVSDNEGSHYINNTHRFLVAQDLLTGAVGAQWLLDVTRQISVDPPNTVEILPAPEGKVDLLNILQAHKTYPIAVGLPVTWDEQAEILILKNRFELTKDGLHFSGALVMSQNALQLKIAASLNPTLHIMPQDPGLVDPLILGENSYTIALNNCVAHGINSPVLAGQRLVYLSCEDGVFDVSDYQIYLTVSVE